MEIRLFGPMEVITDGRVVTAGDFAGVKPRQILQILALNVGRPVTKEQLAELLWDGKPPASHLPTIEGYVSLMRRAVEPGKRARDSVVITSTGSYRLDAERVTVDAAVVEAASRSLRGVAPADLGTGGLRVIDEALSLQRGELLAGERYEAWAVEAREAMAATTVTMLRVGARAAVAAGDWERGCELAGRTVTLDPLAEDAWELQMDALWRGGQAGKALRVYDDLAVVLQQEMGLPPSPRVQQLATRIRNEHLRGREVTPRRLPEPARGAASTLVTWTIAALGLDLQAVRPAALEQAVSDLADQLGQLQLLGPAA